MAYLRLGIPYLPPGDLNANPDVHLNPGSSVTCPSDGGYIEASQYTPGKQTITRFGPDICPITFPSNIDVLFDVNRLRCVIFPFQVL